MKTNATTPNQCTKCGAIEDLSSEITPEETDDPDTSYPMYYSSTTERQ